MARKSTATTPLYAVVGAGDLVAEFARGYASNVQARLLEAQTKLSKVEREPKALRDQARTVVFENVDGLAQSLRTTQKDLEGRLNETVADVNETYESLANRGEKLVGRINRQQSTQSAKSAAKTTTAKAKTAKTQTTKSAKSTADSATKSAKSTAASAKKSADTTKTAAKKTADTAKTNAKATTTAAKKTAESTTQAATEATSKVGD